MLTARYATLVNQCGLKMWEVYDLTPRQIDGLYFHPRDEDGSITVPEVRAPGAGPDAGRLAQLLALAPALGVPAEKLAELKRRLEAASNGNSPGPT